MGDIELLPCPHCGDPPQRTKTSAWCAYCEGYKSHELWNTRHGPALLARQEGEETVTFGGVTSRFVDGMGWVIACSDVPHYMRGMVEKMSTARSGGGG